MLPVPTVSYLASFTGRDEASFGAFADQALIQSTLLFSTLTKLSDYPDDEDKELLAINAILEMADRIYLEQPYATTKASPFQSETIASYSYSKGSVVARAKEGLRTGLLFWDLAMDELSAADRSLVGYGSVTAFEGDLYVDTDDNRIVLTPAQVAASEITWLGGDNIELNPRPRLG